jgi:putative peptidoglycan lipid II flippase
MIIFFWWTLMIDYDKRSILAKTSWLSFFIFINKPIGFLRDILQNRYFGIGEMSDAYIIAWRIPNIFRRIFGEGLLNSVLLPYLVEIKNKHDSISIEEIVTAISIVLQSIVLLFSLIISWNSHAIIKFLFLGSECVAKNSSILLSILIFFTFFITWSALLGIPLQLKKNFYIGAQSQFLVNIALCIEFYLSQKYNLNILTVMYAIVGNGIIILAFHFFMYKKYGYSFKNPSLIAYLYCFAFFKRFFLALISSLLLESNALLSLSFASYLEVGVLSINEILLTLIRIPQQIFGSALSSVSNLTLTEYVTTGSEKLYDYVNHINTILFYASLFISFGIYIFGRVFFSIFFYFSNIVNTIYIVKAEYYLLLLSLTLYPALISKIMVNIIYAHKNVFASTLISFFTICIQNIFLYFTIQKYQISSCILSYLIGDIIRFLFLFIFLKLRYNINIYSSLNRKKIFIFFCVIFISFFITMFLYDYILLIFDRNMFFFHELVRTALVCVFILELIFSNISFTYF